MRSISIRFLAGLLVGVALTLGLLAWRQPKSMGDEERAMAIRMRSFVRALSEPPVNEDPASQWRPLLKGRPLPDESALTEDGRLSCGVCHGAAGEDYDRSIARGELDDGVDHPAGVRMA